MYIREPLLTPEQTAQKQIDSQLKDDSLTDTSSLPKPAVIAAEIVELLEEALEEFRAVEEELKG